MTKDYGGNNHDWYDTFGDTRCRRCDVLVWEDAGSKPCPGDTIGPNKPFGWRDKSPYELAAIAAHPGMDDPVYRMDCLLCAHELAKLDHRLAMVVEGLKRAQTGDDRVPRSDSPERMERW